MALSAISDTVLVLAFSIILTGKEIVRNHFLNWHIKFILVVTIGQ